MSLSFRVPALPALLALALAAVPAAAVAQDRAQAPPEDVLDAAGSVVAVHTPLTTGAAFVLEGAADEGVTHDGVVRGQETARITTIDGRAMEGTVIGRDAAAGLAVLSVPGVRVPPLSLAPESAGEGDEVFAIGRPLGYGDRLRRLEVEARSGEGARRRIELSDSASPDGLGGPLVTPDGGVVGVVVADAPSSALAVPVGRAARIARAEVESVSWTTVGVGVVALLAVVVGLASWSAARGQRRWREHLAEGEHG